MATETPTIELSEFLAVLRRRAGLIALSVGAFTLVALAFALTRPSVYSSTAAVAIPGAPPTSQSQRVVDPPDIETEIAVMSSDLVATGAAGRLGTRLTIPQLRANLTVSAPTDARVMVLTYTAGSATAARNGARAFAEAYTARKRADRQQTLSRQASIFARRISSIDDSISTQEEIISTATPGSDAAVTANNSLLGLQDARRDLDSQLTEIRAEDIDDGQIITPARRPGSPVPRNLGRTVAAGLALGLLVGVGAAFIRDRLDESIRGEDDIERGLGVATLGTIPVFSERPTRSNRLVATHEPDSLAADAFRRLRTATLLACRDAGARTIGVTASIKGEGATTVAANLAVALSQGGRRTLLLAADVRGGALGALFDLDRGPGLTDLLTGTTTYERVVRRVGDLDVITEGRPTRTATDMLYSPATGDLLRALQARYDLIVVDTAPVLQVADALALAPSLDAFLVVAVPGAVTRTQVAETRAELGRAGATLLGAVVNRSVARGRPQARRRRLRRPGRS